MMKDVRLQIAAIFFVGFVGFTWLFLGAPIPTLEMRPLKPNSDLPTFNQVRDWVRENGDAVGLRNAQAPDNHEQRNIIREQLSVTMDILENEPCDRDYAKDVAKAVVVYIDAIEDYGFESKKFDTEEDRILKDRMKKLMMKDYLAIEDFEGKAPMLMGLMRRTGRDRYCQDE